MIDITKIMNETHCLYRALLEFVYFCAYELTVAPGAYQKPLPFLLLRKRDCAVNILTFELTSYFLSYGNLQVLF